MGNQKQKIDSGDVAKGAAAVTIAAGVVAAGVLLSDKKNRKKVGKFAQKGMKMARDMAREISDQASDKLQAAKKEVPVIEGQIVAKKIKAKPKTKKSKATS